VQLTRIAVLSILAASAARADGVLEVRGAYYKERSTRVEQPMIDAAFDAGERGVVVGHFLVDSITSASQATGTAAGEFTERRYEAGLGYTHELPGRLKIGGDFRYSTESDYFSTWLDLHGELALADQDLRLRVLVGHSFDKITNGVAVDQGAIGTATIEHSLGVNLLSLGATYLLTPDLVGAIGYDLGYLDGYQANVYRMVPGGSQPVPERVPTIRVRNAIGVELRGFLPSTRTTGVLAYHFYIDDWGVVAHTPEARVVQELLPGLELRARYRYYTQTKADFYQTVYNQAQLDDLGAHVTNDEKLSGFRTQTLGGQLNITMANLGFPGTFGKTRVDLIVERIWQDNSFGDAWVGQLGLTLPLVY